MKDARLIDIIILWILVALAWMIYFIPAVELSLHGAMLINNSMDHGGFMIAKVDFKVE